MNILFDQGVPVPLRRSLSGHIVHTVYELGWSTVTNGQLLTMAEQAGYAVFVTTDQNLRYQQNLGGRTIAILVLTSTSWPRIQPHVPTISALVDHLGPGTFHELPI